MNSIIQSQLPPALQQRTITLAQQQLQMQSQFCLSSLSLSSSLDSQQISIENCFCLRQDHQLVKVTYIRIGNEMLTLTDRLTIKQEPNEDDSKTKSSTNSTTMKTYQTKAKRNYLSSSSKTILGLFEKWLHQNFSQSGLLLSQIKEIYKSQHELITAITNNQQLREHLLFFQRVHKVKTLRKCEQKILKRWINQCQLIQNQQDKNINILEEGHKQNKNF